MKYLGAFVALLALSSSKDVGVPAVLVLLLEVKHSQLLIVKLKPTKHGGHSWSGTASAVARNGRGFGILITTAGRRYCVRRSRVICPYTWRLYPPTPFCRNARLGASVRASMVSSGRFRV